MPLFFMIAGYAHGMKDHFSNGQKFSGYLKKYVIELYLPALYFSFIFWLQKYLRSSLTNDVAGLQLTSAENFFYIPLLGILEYWFICTLFFIKTLHILLENVCKRKMLLSAFWVLSFVVITLFSSSLPKFIARFSFGFYFHIGYLMRQHGLITADNHPKFYYGIIMLITGIIILFLPASVMNYTVSTLISIAFFIIFYSLGVCNSFLMKCGIYSMVIYATHIRILVLNDSIFRFMGLSSSVNVLVLRFISIVIAILVPLGVVWLYKNVKSLRWIEYIFYPGKLLLKK